MSALIVDTSSWVSYLARGKGSVIDEALAEGRVFLPGLVAAELCSGKMSARQREELESFLRELPLCVTDLGHWLRVGLLRARLRSGGVSISTPDAHIAQCALDMEAELLTEDAIFKKVAPKIKLKLLA